MTILDYIHFKSKITHGVDLEFRNEKKAQHKKEERKNAKHTQGQWFDSRKNKFDFYDKIKHHTK